MQLTPFSPHAQAWGALARDEDMHTPTQGDLVPLDKLCQEAVVKVIGLSGQVVAGAVKTLCAQGEVLLGAIVE